MVVEENSEDPSAAMPPSRRRGWRLAAIGLLAGTVVGSAVTATYLGTRPPAVSSAADQPSASTNAGSPSPTADPARLRTAVSAALQRIAPGSTLGPGIDGEIELQVGVPEFQLTGEIEANGRSGALNLLVRDGGGDVPCDHFTPPQCQVTTGPHGETIWSVAFERPLDPGQPRSLEIHAGVIWPGSSVHVSVNNDVAPAMGLPATAPGTTGQDPPLTLDQVKALAVDSSVNVCATPCSTGSPG